MNSFNTLNNKNNNKKLINKFVFSSFLLFFFSVLSYCSFEDYTGKKKSSETKSINTLTTKQSIIFLLRCANDPLSNFVDPFRHKVDVATTRGSAVEQKSPQRLCLRVLVSEVSRNSCVFGSPPVK